MNKTVALKSLAAAVAIYAAGGFFGVPYVLKNIVPEKVSEATKGGQFSIDHATFNPFTFRLGIEGALFKTPSGEALFDLDKLVLNVDPSAYLWTGGWVIDSISLEGPKVALNRDANGTLNVDWLMQPDAPEEDKKDSSKLKLLIRSFVLKEGAFAYSDRFEGRNFRSEVNSIALALDNIDLRDVDAKEGKLRFYAAINDGGFLDLHGKIDRVSALKIDGNVSFDSGKLHTPWEYFKEKLPIEVADGRATLGFEFHLDGDDLNATRLGGVTFDLKKLRLIPKGENRTLLNIDTIGLKNATVFPMRKRFDAEGVEIGGVEVSASRGRDGVIDWMRYVKEIQEAFPSDENETKEPWAFRIGRFALNGLNAGWEDFAPREPYRLNLSGGRVETGAVSSDENESLNLSLSTDRIELLRHRDGVSVASLGGIGVEGIGIDRAGHFASVEKVSLNTPSVMLKRQKDGSIDLARYAYAAPKSAPDPQAVPWKYRVGEVELFEGRVGCIDEVPARRVTYALEKLNLNLRSIDADPKVKNFYRLSGRLNKRTDLVAEGDFTRASMSSSGRFGVRRLNVSTFDPYIEPSTYASLRRGEVSVKGDYRYVPSKASVNGKIALSDWVVNDTRDDSVLLGWQNIGATPFVYAYPDNRLKINQLAVDGLYTNALIDEKKVLNFSTLSKTAAVSKEANTTVSPARSGNPFGIDIIKLLVRDSSATFSDLSLPLPFKTYIHDLEGSVLGISTTKDVTTFLKLRGGVDQYGLASVDGSLNTNAPKRFTDVKVAFENLDLQHYTPYSLKFLGYKITGGKLFLNLGYKINEGKLNASNQVIIKQIELGEEQEGGSPWPMRLVVALLEDSQGVIDIDLPIEGDVNSPDFKYGKVVWQVVTNIFTKAVTSPFRLLASMMGIEDNALSTIDFEDGSATLLPPQIEKLDQVVQMLQKRPKLMLNVYGGWDEKGDGEVLKERKLVDAALKRDKNLKIDSAQAMSVELLEELADDTIGKSERKALREPLEKEYTEEAAFVRHYSAELIKRLIAHQTIAPAEFEALGRKRAEAIQRYLGQTPGIDKRLGLGGVEKAKEPKEGIVPVRMEVVVQK